MNGVATGLASVGSVAGLYLSGCGSPVNSIVSLTLPSFFNSSHPTCSSLGNFLLAADRYANVSACEGDPGGGGCTDKETPGLIAINLGIVAGLNSPVCNCRYILACCAGSAVKSPTASNCLETILNTVALRRRAHSLAAASLANSLVHAIR